MFNPDLKDQALAKERKIFLEYINQEEKGDKNGAHPTMVINLHDGYEETDAYFFSGNNQVMYSTYTTSEGDKCAIEYINKSLENHRRELENQHMEEVLQKWTVPDNPRRKKRTESAGDTYKERVDLFDILAFAIQLAMVMLAWKW